MEKTVRTLFNDQVYTIAASKYGVTLNNISYVGGFQNYVFEYQRQGIPYILRIAHCSHRSLELTKGEIDWIHYLYDHGVPVSKAIPSTHDNLVETIEINDEVFFVTSFMKAEGKVPDESQFSSDPISLQKLGQLTGRIHALSKKYEPKNKTIRRYDWHENNYLLKRKLYIPDSQSAVHNKCTELMTTLHSLPKENDSYGLIHGDLNYGNFSISTSGKITVFDFDECEYGWFMSDIAIQLYYATYIHLGSQKKKDEVADFFMQHYWRAYEQENSLDSFWLDQIPLFLKLREFLVYIGSYRSFDLSELNDFAKRFLDEARTRIELGDPVVHIFS